MEVKSIWTHRFVTAALIHGILATLITLYVVIGQITWLKPSVSRVIALGSAGNWFTFGYLSYLLVGVLGSVATAFFYNYVENVMKREFKGLTSMFAWLHIILFNIGVIGSTWMMMYGGYKAGAAMLPVEVGGLGWNPGQVHQNIFYAIPYGYPLWIAAFVIIGGLGVLAGALAILSNYTRK